MGHLLDKTHVVSYVAIALYFSALGIIIFAWLIGDILGIGDTLFVSASVASTLLIGVELIILTIFSGNENEVEGDY